MEKSTGTSEHVATLLMTDWWYALMLLGIIVGTGILGGYASYHLSESDDRSKTRSITLGVVAAFIVPVFLNMISSNLLVEAQKNIDKFFIFAGFCVLASVFSRNFLENIYNKVLQQVGSIGDKVKEIEEAAVEPDVPEADVSSAILKEHGLTENEFKLLKIFSGGRFTYRSITGLKKDSGMERSDVDSFLNSLLSKGLIQSRLNDKKQMRYFLSGEGRQLLGSISTE